MDYVFVYGTLKKGRSNHSVIQAGKFISDAVLDGGLMFTTPGFPVLFDGPNKIYGELYLVNPTIMNRLDGLENNGRMFERKQVEVVVPDGTKYSSWVYFGVPKYWNVEPSTGKVLRNSSWLRQMDASQQVQVY